MIVYRIREMALDSGEVDEYVNPALLADLVGVDKDCIPEWGFAVLGVIAKDGSPHLETRTYGEPSVGTLVGVLEIIKQEIVMQMLEDND